MMFRRPMLLLALVLATAACEGSAPPQVTTIQSFPITSMDGVLTRTGVAFDEHTSADGNGSLRVTAEGRTTVRLFETGDVDVEGAVLTYAAKLRTEGVEGRVYLEMWTVFPGQGEYFSRALHQPLTGSVEWTSQQTPFVLEGGQNPENLKLNLVIEGPGTVWIDEVKVTAAS